MKRREFITLLGGAAAAWPLPTRAQQPAMPVIGFMSSGSATPWAHLVAAFRDGLKAIGFVEGQNVAIDFHWADGQYDRLPTIAAELVRRKVAVIVAVGGAPAVLPAVAATPTIPIVFSTGGDPIKLGIVRSLNRPAGNATGVYLFAADIEAKRLGLLRDLVPTSALIGVLLNPNNANAVTRGLQAWCYATSMREHFTVATAAMVVGLESQVPSIYKKQIIPLREVYGFTEDEIEFFDLHITSDVVHGERGFQIVLENADTVELQQRCLQFVRWGAEMRYSYTRSLYDTYVAPDMVAA